MKPAQITVDNDGTMSDFDLFVKALEILASKCVFTDIKDITPIYHGNPHRPADSLCLWIEYKGSV